MSIQSSTQPGNALSSALVINIDIATLSVTEYDKAELRKRKESLNKTIGRLTVVKNTINAIGYVANITEPWAPGASEAVGAIGLLVDIVRGPLDGQLSAIFLVERAVNLLADLLDAIRSGQQPPFKPIVDDILSFKVKINAALEPVSQIAHEGGRFKLCAHPFALGKAVRTANSELDKLTDSYQLTISVQTRVGQQQMQDAIIALRRFMETNQTELVEFLKQDEEEMQNWMKEMGKNMDELKTKIDELPAKVVEELQRASKNPPMFKLEIGGIYIQAGTSLPPTTAQPVTYSSPPPTSSMPGIVSEPKPVLYYKSRKGSGIPAKIGGLFKFKLRSIRAHNEDNVMWNNDQYHLDDTFINNANRISQPGFDPEITQFWRNVGLASAEKLRVKDVEV